PGSHPHPRSRTAVQAGLRPAWGQAGGGSYFCSIRMRNTGTKVSATLLLAAVVLSGCLKAEEFPTVPHIAFKSYEQRPDSAELTISFTDGAGDIGLNQGDTLAPFNPGSPWYHNFF